MIIVVSKSDDHDSVPDPRARRGPWYSLTAILLAVIGIRRHLLRWRRTPSSATIGRVLGAVEGDVPDQAVGAYLTVSPSPAKRSVNEA